MDRINEYCIENLLSDTEKKKFKKLRKEFLSSKYYDKDLIKHYQDISYATLYRFMNLLFADKYHPFPAILQIMSDISNKITFDMHFKNEKMPKDIYDIEAIAKLFKNMVPGCNVIPTNFEEIIRRIK